MFVMCAVTFAALWWAANAFSPVPTVPNRVYAVVGSCVIIPCSFNPPDPMVGGWQPMVKVRVRYQRGGSFFQSIVFNSEIRDQVTRDFHGRTDLYGHITEGDCSVRIQSVRKTDARAYVIELKGGYDSSWGKAINFNLAVSEIPEPPTIHGPSSAKEGEVVNLNCTITHSCPSMAPTLRWHLVRGAEDNSIEQYPLGVLYPKPQWNILQASLSFIAWHNVKPRLRCEATFPGNPPVSALHELHVTFPPKDVKVQVLSQSVQEGSNVLLTCSCKADPPVTKYSWSYTQHGHTLNLTHQTHTLRVYNVSRDMRVSCSAKNRIGKGLSQPMALDIQYKPHILPLSSSCVWNTSKVMCKCLVDSNPKPAITWSVNGSAPPSGYNMSVTPEEGGLTALLRGCMDTPQRVVCFAVNALGNDSSTLLQDEQVRSSLWWPVIPAATILVTVFILSVILTYCCRRRTVKSVMNCRPPAVYSGETGIYQDRMPLYINCNEVTHIYTNGSYQLVYQNCTPVFVRTKQIGKQGGERRLRKKRGEEIRGVENGQSRSGVTRVTQSPAAAEIETAIYLEII